MHVEAFAGHYRTIASLYGCSPAELETRDRSEHHLLRWVAWESGIAIGALQVQERPDRRKFLSFKGDESAFAALIDRPILALDGNLYCSTTDQQPNRRSHLIAAGFVPEVETEVFSLSFAATIDRLRHAPVPPGFELQEAREVDPKRLFDLDNAVRSRVPGMDGWQGRWDWFVAELDDPAAYLVAVDPEQTFAGLARIWHNPEGPRFGLVGTRPEYGGSRIGPALLRTVLEAAAAWGYPTFTAETAVTNTFLHSRMKTVATSSIGMRTQLVRPGAAGTA